MILKDIVHLAKKIWSWKKIFLCLFIFSVRSSCDTVENVIETMKFLKPLLCLFCLFLCSSSAAPPTSFTGPCGCFPKSHFQKYPEGPRVEVATPPCWLMPSFTRPSNALLHHNDYLDQKWRLAGRTLRKMRKRSKKRYTLWHNGTRITLDLKIRIVWTQI